MIFWLIAAALTAVVTLILVGPLIRGAAPHSDAAAHDLEVYRDQLAELDRDIEAGLIANEEADYARAEIGRRLLKAANRTKSQRAPASSTQRIAALLVLIAVPVLGTLTYVAIGSPGEPAQPASARAPTPSSTDVASLVQQAETYLAENPGDGRGWDVLAPIYVRSGRLEDAEIAFKNSIRLNGENAQRLIGLGEVLTLIAGGIITEEASSAFENAAKLAPRDPRPLFYRAQALVQEGRDVEALAAFEQLASQSPAGAAWMEDVNQRIVALGGSVATPGASPLGNPSQDDIAAANEMAAEDRQQMIQSMVASLDEKLRDEPNNIEGWLRLVRSYVVLGDGQNAENALKRALAVYAAPTREGQSLIALATELGLENLPVNGESTQ